MKENKELKDLLTTGVIVEICNEVEEEEESIKYIGVVMGDTILYDYGHDSVDGVVSSTKRKDSDYYISKIYSPNKKCHKLKDLLDNSNSDIIWVREEKLLNRLTREEFAKLPFGTKIIGINESKNMEELEFVKIRDYYTDHAVLCLSNYKTDDFLNLVLLLIILKRNMKNIKKNWQTIKINI